MTERTDKVTTHIRKPKGPSRRTKHVSEGRDWECLFCAKSYLSAGSVVHHVRGKHLEEPTAAAFINL
jgi:hypothetical protein